MRDKWRVKLPKTVLRKLSGDPLDWKSFKRTFEATVLVSDSTCNVEKFTYLKTYLGKSALQAIEGFPPTNESYTAPWQLLDENIITRTERSFRFLWLWWKVRKWTLNYILSHKQSDKIRSNYLNKCKRNAKVARYHRKQCVSFKKFSNKIWTFRTFVSAYYIRKNT